MFKRFLMENAHRDHVTNLFMWWNGHVFSFEMVPGINRRDSDGFDSGMDEAEAALNSDEEFIGENFGDDIDGRHPDDSDLSVNFARLTIPERSVTPLDPVAAPVYTNLDAIVVPWDREPTLIHSDAGVASITTFTSFAH
jgi:hypothetical protein